MVRVLGVSASLRNARFGVGSDLLVEELSKIGNQNELEQYLSAQTKFRLDDFVSAGRSENKPFDELYANLRKMRGERGLSNSEAACAVALWAARQEGADIGHVSLAEHFPMQGKGKNLDGLRQQLLAADAIIISGPVYFGDRGSLAQSLLEFIAADESLREGCKGKVYGGITVGAKRNGGQETTLIYQLVDMVNLNFLAVGNSSDTTAQYGGTAVAGDVGKLHADAEGIETCIGTGRRVARVARLLEKGRSSTARLIEPLNIQLWLLQDDDRGTGHSYFSNWAREISERQDVKVQVFDATREQVMRCISCDICPTDVGPVDDYRCIITSKSDFFVRHHESLVKADAVLMCAYSPTERDHVVSAYQQFIERTRYLRRDNYALTDLLFAPFVISELSARQNLHMRMLTSGIRHHTVLHRPIIGMVHEGRLLNEDSLIERGQAFVERARELSLGRYQEDRQADLIYHTIGYEVSTLKAQDDAASGKTQRAVDAAADAHASVRSRRIKIMG